MLQVCGRAVSLGDEETAKLGCGILDDCVESPAGVVHPHLAPTPALTPALAPEPSPDPNPNPAPIPRLPLPRSTRTWLPSWPSRRTRPSVAASKRKRAPSALNLLAPPPIPPIFRDLSPQVRLRAQPARDGRSAQAQARRQAAARPPSGAHALRDLCRGGGARRGRRRAEPAQARRTGPLHLLCSACTSSPHRPPPLTMAPLTMAVLTMAPLTMALPTMALPTMAPLTMALPTMALLTMALLTMAGPRRAGPPSALEACRAGAARAGGAASRLRLPLPPQSCPRLSRCHRGGVRRGLRPTASPSPSP